MQPDDSIGGACSPNKGQQRWLRLLSGVICSQCQLILFGHHSCTSLVDWINWDQMLSHCFVGFELDIVYFCSRVVY